MGSGAPGRPPPGATGAFDLDLSAVQSEVVKRGYGHWRNRCSGRLPSRAMIDPADIPELLPHVVIDGVRRDPLDFVYRLIGTEVRRHMSQDRTGQWMSAIPSSSRRARSGTTS